jgi:MinD superfamily P-loop ATPase
LIKELVILSGKGGTGKTSLAAAFASVAENGVLCDADVDAADLHLLMEPDIQRRTEFMGGNTAIIDAEKCSQCGQCIELCRFDAINDHFIIDEIDCEGCGVCVDLCPEQAIDFPVKKCGEWFISNTRFGAMVHARLGIAEENSGKLVTLVRQEAKKLAQEHHLKLIITDGPPGVGCPVIASVGGATAALVVTEPTVSGLHDMQRVLELARHFNVPCMLCINKFDLNLDQTAAVEKIAQASDIPIVGKVPFDPHFTRSMVQGKTIFEYDPNCQLSLTIKQVWQTVRSNL